MPASRKIRLAETLREELSQVIRTELRDPRLAAGLLSITGVDVSADLKYATVYVSIFGDDLVRKEMMTALKGASGILRAELGRTKAFKSVPALTFRYDDSIERGISLSRALETAMKMDAGIIPEETDESNSA
jgi:ribosome-binding factor A